MKTVDELRKETSDARIKNFENWTETVLAELIDEAVKRGAYFFTTNISNLNIPVGYSWTDIKNYLKSVDDKFEVSIYEHHGWDEYDSDYTNITVSWAEPSIVQNTEEQPKKKHFWNLRK